MEISLKDRTKGILCMISAAFFFALMGLFVKLAGDVPSMEKSFFRNIVAFTIALTAVIKSHKRYHCNAGDWGYLMVRSVCGTIGIFANFYAIDHLVLADASMLNKLSPFFAVIMSYLILKERCTPVQFGAVFIAFVGALFIIKPTGSINSFPAVVGAIGGLGAGIAYTMVRALGKRGVPGELIIMVFSAFSCIASIPFVIADFKPLTLYQFVILLCAGFAAAGGQFSITRAYMYAPAKQISVYDYTQIIFSTLMGFIFLNQVPDVYSIIGYVVICSMAVGMFLYNKNKDEHGES